MMAIFNRGLLLDQTGDSKGAIQDYSTVINEYPNFLLGYQYRAQARRKIGDVKGADADEFKVWKAQLDKDVDKRQPVDRLQQERSGGRAGLCDNCFLFAKTYGGPITSGLQST